MPDKLQPRVDSPLEGAPTWVRAVQAAVIGMIAGFVLHAMLSGLPLSGQQLDSRPAGTFDCRKSAPARDVVTPPAAGPSVSELGWSIASARG